MIAKAYAGVGSRETPDDVIKAMRGISKALDERGYMLRSGGAQGADKAFESRSTNKEVFLPSDDLPAWTEVFTDFFHPNPGALKDYSRKLMCRNAMQILGRDGDSPVEFVVCWTKQGSDDGGTGQAIRIAWYYGIPVFNLRNDGGYEMLKDYLRTLRKEEQ